ALHRDLDDRVTIERKLERLAHARVLAERILLRQVALADVDRDALVADLDDLRDLEAAVATQARDVRRADALDEIELPGAQVREAHRRIDDRQVDDAVEMDVALVPVLRKALEHDPVLRDPLDEAERPGAHRLRAELLSGGFGGLRRHHHARTI